MKEKLLVVVEPTRDRHHALERMLYLYSAGFTDIEVLVLITVNSESNAMDAGNSQLYKDRDWFLDLIAPLDEAGLTYRLQICWSTEFQQSILKAADDFAADLLFVPARDRDPSGLFRFSDAKWTLLRNAPCPVLIVQPGAVKSRDCVLAAVRMEGTDPIYERLNDTIMRFARRVVQGYDAELHVVNAYASQEDYPDRGRLANLTGLDNEHIHVEEGPPDEVVARVAKQIGADLVLIGTRARSGIAAIRGNTAERLISSLTDLDVFTVNCS